MHWETEKDDDDKLDEYRKAENFIGLDELLIWQRPVDGSIALRQGSGSCQSSCPQNIDGVLPHPLFTNP